MKLKKLEVPASDRKEAKRLDSSPQPDKMLSENKAEDKIASTDTNHGQGIGISHSTSQVSLALEPRDNGRPVATVTMSAQAAASGLYKTKFQQDFLRLMHKLRSCGADQEVELPKMAVVGNQSSGKSSVIEAISGITLPRASGTCTRCPFEVSLLQADCDWTCKVSLRLGQSRDGGDKVQEIPFGPPIKHLHEVEERFRRAQGCILAMTSAQDSVDSFLHRKINELPDEKGLFTHNTVCVLIEDREAVNLSFLDLPGIISSVSQGEPVENIEKVKNLARSVIQQRKCIILLTIACTDDINNQAGVQLARDADPEGERTIGVLTKTDQIQESDHKEWIDILSGKKEKLLYGYYAVKNPSPKQLAERISSIEARRSESDFFMTAPWNELDSGVRARMGIFRLTQRLSTLLEASVRECLPNVTGELQARLSETKGRLGSMPKKVEPAESVTFVAGLCTDFKKRISEALSPSARQGTGSNLLRDVNQKALGSFANAVKSSEPQFCVVGGDMMLKDLGMPSSQVCHYALTRQNRGRDACYVRERTLFGRKQRVVYTITEVTLMIKESRTIELPGNIPYKVTTDLILASFEHLAHLSERCFQETKLLLSELVSHHILAVFEQFKLGGLQLAVQEILADLQHDCEERFQPLLEALIKSDTSLVFTNNSDAFNEEKEKRLGKLRERRDSSNFTGYPKNEDMWKEIISKLMESGVEEKKAKEMRLHIQDEDLEEELQLCAEVQTYWTIAAHRIVDALPAFLIVHYLRRFHDEVYQALCGGLGIFSPEGAEMCARFLEEQEDVACERQELITRARRLEEGLKAMRSFGAA